MNYMEQVAKMLGVELEEEFSVKYSVYKYKITERGLERFSKIDKEWLLNSVKLRAILCGDYEIEKSILDEVEKQYLTNVINPFRDRVLGIAKCTVKGDKYEFIAVYIKELNCRQFAITLPLFKEGAMYKGMEADKRYTLEELCL